MNILNNEENNDEIKNINQINHIDKCEKCNQSDKMNKVNKESGEEKRKTNKAKKVGKFTKRNVFQLAYGVLTNSFFAGFAGGKIYTGSTKMVCVPGLNCYSCPGARGACPIGSLQAVLGGRGKGISYYVFGLIILFGVLFGRFVCGFLCPFGFIQDMLYKIPTKKLKVNPKIDKPARYLKYVIAAVFVILLPMFLVNKYGMGDPFFCKYICPAGTLEAGIPLVIKNEYLRAGLGFLFNWKVLISIVVIVSSIFIYRPFCKYICPLGAFYSLFNKLSFYQMHVDEEKCIHCGACIRQCKMNVNVIEDINSTECIRCGECKTVCPTDAITSGFRFKHDDK